MPQVTFRRQGDRGRAAAGYIPRNRSEQAEFASARDSLGASGDVQFCLLYTSDAADERSSVDLGGRRILKKQKQEGHVNDRCVDD